MNSISQPQFMAIMRKMGIAAYVLFVVKGLLWLAAPFLFYFLT